MKKFMMLLCLISMGDLYAKLKDKREDVVEKKQDVVEKKDEKVTEGKADKAADKAEKKEDKKENLTAEEQAKKDAAAAKLEAAKTEVTAGMNLSKKDLKKYRFSQPNLQNIIMDDKTTNDDGIQFDVSPSHYNGVHADLSGADLATADLSMFILDGVLYDENTKLPTTLTAQQKNSMIRIATPGMDLSGQDLDFYYFKGKNISGIILNDKTTFTKTVDFSDANATKAIFTQMNFSNQTAIFRGTTLVEADMSWGDYSGDDLSSIKAQGAKMTSSNFIATNFKNAQLQNVIMLTSYWDIYSFPTDCTNADFSDADLTGADVTGAIFTGAKYNANTKLPATMTIDQKNSMLLVK